VTRYAVRHTTVYEYGGDVAHSHHLLHLTPREFEYQRRLSHSLRLDPPPSSSREDLDAFGNVIARLEYDRSHDRLSVTADMQVEVLPRQRDALEDSEAWDRVRERLSYHASPMSNADLEACRFRMRSNHVPPKQAIEDYARECFKSGRPIGAAAQALTRQPAIVAAGAAGARGAVPLTVPLVVPLVVTCVAEHAAAARTAETRVSAAT